MISRAGAQTYASALSNAHPNAIQVSDRFHLLKIHSEVVENYMRKLFPLRKFNCGEN
ncbi:transposase [Lacrimispora sp.]|uniref:transposase n=1 Tax=Lacrimispora sp. TaxID=2719234 RepID=UPI00289C8B89|nr:transposase [Lacrimispora sp.]